MIDLTPWRLFGRMIMPAPTPLSVRQALWRLAQQDVPAVQIAFRLALPVRTVRNLLQRFRRQPGQLQPAYRPGPGRVAASAPAVRQHALALRQQHPRWGAGYIWVRLQRDFPGQPLPSARTLVRWFAHQQLPAAPAGRRPQLASTRASWP